MESEGLGKTEGTAQSVMGSGGIAREERGCVPVAVILPLTFKRERVSTACCYDPYLKYSSQS